MTVDNSLLYSKVGIRQYGEANIILDDLGCEVAFRYHFLKTFNSSEWIHDSSSCQRSTT
jgi:hypothetical protein